MSDAMTVHVNREGRHSLSVPDSFTASGSFDVVLVNHGDSTHVHLHLDDALSEQAAVDAPNHHVEGDGERRVRVTRTGDGTASGRLKLVTGYGATTRHVDVGLTEPRPADESVPVGEELTRPQPRAESEAAAGLGSVPIGTVLAAGGLAVGLAVGAGAALGSAAAVVGAVAVALLVVGVVVAVLASRT
ncbi:DUF7524 family protein [Haloarcula onubensis]|uniref:Uncharacterized protein n=1 Tax=Haloarcula onubensis TaxID=2950539 RepID=A0ABU2FQA4_9EURY|nr:hypothetical protein [Halomicroarcula sp. S3CR25-11]MDS0282938.1 hypothetical protein [Halomicroarcula sp. S3CR25-11]